MKTQNQVVGGGELVVFIAEYLGNCDATSNLSVAAVTHSTVKT